MIALLSIFEKQSGNSIIMQFTPLAVLFTATIITLATTSPTTTGADATVEIQQTLNLFPISVDTKNYTILADLFTPDASADFAIVPVVYGLSAISSGLQKELQGLVSQHSFTTQSITVHGDRTASAITYLIANFFGQGNLTGQVYTNYGQYRDTLKYVDGVGWRVSNKTLVNTVSSFRQAPSFEAELTLSCQAMTGNRAVVGL